MSETPEAKFMRVLGIDAETASRLVFEGLTSLEQVAFIPLEELQEIQGLRNEQILEWRKRAKFHLLAEDIARENDDEEPAGEPQPSAPKPPRGGSGSEAAADSYGPGDTAD